MAFVPAHRTRELALVLGARAIGAPGPAGRQAAIQATLLGSRSLKTQSASVSVKAALERVRAESAPREYSE